MRQLGADPLHRVDSRRRSVPRQPRDRLRHAVRRVEGEVSAGSRGGTESRLRRRPDRSRPLTGARQRRPGRAPAARAPSSSRRSGRSGAGAPRYAPDQVPARWRAIRALRATSAGRVCCVNSNTILALTLSSRPADRLRSGQAPRRIEGRRLLQCSGIHQVPPRTARSDDPGTSARRGGLAGGSGLRLSLRSAGVTLFNWKDNAARTPAKCPATAPARTATIRP